MRICKKCQTDITHKRADALFCSKICKKKHWDRQKYPIPAKRLTEQERKTASKLYKANWRKANLEKHRSNMRKYCKKRYQLDIPYRLSCNVRNRLCIAIKSNYKSGSAVSDLGCSVFKLKMYLLMKFHRNPRGNHEYMTWDNQGEWHIDHIIPLSSFNLSDPVQLKIACHYSNLRPMWAIDNIKKGTTIIVAPLNYINTY